MRLSLLVACVLGLAGSTAFAQPTGGDEITSLGEQWKKQRRPGDLDALIAQARKTGWDKALPYLRVAIAEVDAANPSSIDSAGKAADALGESHAADAADILAPLVKKPASAALAPAQVRALRALGEADRARAVPLLLPIVDRDRPGPDRFHLQVAGAAINALNQHRDARAVEPLVLALYRYPELFEQTRRALAGTGPTAAAALRRVLQDRHPGVAAIVKARGLDRRCEPGATSCEGLSLKDHLAAQVLGDLRDASAVPDLLAALARPARPAYVDPNDGAPGPTQVAAITDALRKIGAPAAAPALRALWAGAGKADPLTRAHAIEAYAYVARDASAAEELGKIAVDNTADEGLRRAALFAYGRLATDARGIPLIQKMAQRFLDESAKKEREAASLTDARARKHVEDAARSYLAFARMFQAQAAGIAVAERCRADAACYAAALDLTGDDVAKQVERHIPGATAWTTEEKAQLVLVTVERAGLELGKLGRQPQKITDRLLHHAASTERFVRQVMWMALPKVAPLPCAACEAQLRAYAAAHASEPEPGVIANYFAWAR